MRQDLSKETIRIGTLVKADGAPAHLKQCRGESFVPNPRLVQGNSP